jgi:hypothetical protein
MVFIKIHVIKGQIQITKNVTEISDTDRTFTFNVNAKNGQNGQNVSNSQVSVTVKANEKEEHLRCRIFQEESIR